MTDLEQLPLSKKNKCGDQRGDELKHEAGFTMNKGLQVFSNDSQHYSLCSVSMFEATGCKNVFFFNLDAHDLFFLTGQHQYILY